MTIVDFLGPEKVSTPAFGAKTSSYKKRERCQFVGLKVLPSTKLGGGQELSEARLNEGLAIGQKEGLSTKS